VASTGAAPKLVTSAPLEVNPYSRAEAGQGATILLDVLNYFIQKAADKNEQEAIQREWAKRPLMEESLKKGIGILVWAQYTEVQLDPESGIHAPRRFDQLVFQAGPRNQPPPPAVTGRNETPVREVFKYISPPPEAAKQLNVDALKTRLSELWDKQHAFQDSGQRMAKENPLGRLFKRRAKDHIELGPVYEARSHLSSARIAIRQDRLQDAANSMDMAEKALNQMWDNIQAYRGYRPFDE